MNCLLRKSHQDELCMRPVCTVKMWSTTETRKRERPQNLDLIWFDHERKRKQINKKTKSSDKNMKQSWAWTRKGTPVTTRLEFPHKFSEIYVQLQLWLYLCLLFGVFGALCKVDLVTKESVKGSGEVFNLSVSDPYRISSSIIVIALHKQGFTVTAPCKSPPAQKDAFLLLVFRFVAAFLLGSTERKNGIWNWEHYAQDILVSDQISTMSWTLCGNKTFFISFPFSLFAWNRNSVLFFSFLNVFPSFT